jgi:hypothetical protein
MPFLRHDRTAPLTRLECLWQSCLPASFDDIEAPAQLFRSTKSPERQRRLCGAVKDVVTEFDMIPKVDLISQVFMLMDCLLQISCTSADSHVVEQILKYLLKLCNRVGIITTVTVMSAVFMPDNEFRRLCSRDELAAWSLFEGVVLTLMAKDEALSRLAVSLHDDILDQNWALSTGGFLVHIYGLCPPSCLRSECRVLVTRCTCRYIPNQNISHLVLCIRSSTVILQQTVNSGI